MKELLTIFPLFLSIGFTISNFLFLLTKEETFLTLSTVYLMIIQFFLLINFMQISAILETFFGIRENPFLNFFLSLITLFYYLPYYILTVFEKTGFFRKGITFLSFFFPLPCFFVWCYFFYSWLMEKS